MKKVAYIVYYLDEDTGAEKRSPVRVVEILDSAIESWKKSKGLEDACAAIDYDTLEEFFVHGYDSALFEDADLGMLVEFIEENKLGEEK